MNSHYVDLDALIRLAQARYDDAIRAYRLAHDHEARLDELHDQATRMSDTLRQRMEEAHQALRALLA